MRPPKSILHVLQVLFGLLLGSLISFSLAEFRSVYLTYQATVFVNIFVGAFVAGLIIQQRGWLVGLVVVGLGHVLTVAALAHAGALVHQSSFWRQLHEEAVSMYSAIVNTLPQFTVDLCIEMTGAIIGSTVGVKIARKIKQQRLRDVAEI
jgi:hypothetical protein